VRSLCASGRPIDAEQLLAGRPDEPWDAEPRLVAAGVRGAHAPLREASQTFVRHAPHAPGRLLAAHGLDQSRALSEATDALLPLAHDNSAPPRVRADAFDLLMRICADLEDSQLAERSVMAWRQRGMASLDPEYRGGRPRRISDADRRQAVAVAGARPDRQGQPHAPICALSTPGRAQRRPRTTPNSQLIGYAGLPDRLSQQRPCPGSQRLAAVSSTDDEWPSSRTSATATGQERQRRARRPLLDVGPGRSGPVPPTHAPSDGCEHRGG